MKHVPRAYKAHLDGTLESTECWTGSTPFFYFSPNHIERRAGVTYGDTPAEYKADWKVPGVPPDYKTHFWNDVFVYDKPIVIINNKYIEEWHQPPINYLSVHVLDEIIEALYDKYTIVYIRSRTNERGYFNDNQPAGELGDYQLMEKYPNVVLFNSLLNEHPDLTYNELQFMLHANAEKFVSVAGGNAVISSYFGGENIIYRHPKARSDSRVVWHTGSHLRLLSGAKIYGSNNETELIELIKLWL